MAVDALSPALCAANTVLATTGGALASGLGQNAQTGVDFKTKKPARRGNPLAFRILYNTASVSTGTGTLLFTIDHSADNTTWQPLSAAVQGIVALGTTAINGRQDILVPNALEFLRLNAIITGTTGTVTVASCLLDFTIP